MRNIIFTTIITISFVFTVKANTSIDTTYFKNSINHATSLFSINEDSAMFELLKIEKECKHANYSKGLAECYGQMGLLKKQIGDFPKALEFLNKSYDLYQELNAKDGMAALKLSIGAVYVHLSAYLVAKEYIHKSLEYYENTEEYFILAGAYMTLSGVHINMKEYELGHEYINKAIEYYEKISHKWGICACNMNRALILYEQKKYKECIDGLNEVMALAKEINSHNLIATSMVYIGSSYHNLGQYKNAEEYLIKVPGMKMVNSQVLMECYLYIGDLYRSKGDYTNAIKYTNKVVDESKKLDLVGNTMKAYDRLATYYAESGKNLPAYEMQKLAYNLKDSIFDSEKIGQLQRLEAIYQSEKKQQQIENLENENQIQKLKFQKTKITYVGSIGAILIIAVVLSLLFRNSRLKVKSENIKLEQKLLRTQMNPHFIFNAISAIQHYIVKNRPLEASSYLSSFAKLMRSILQNSREELVPLETEIQSLEDYLNLQKLRLDGNLDYKIQGKEEFDTEELAIPPMLLQPFIENAIEHGIMKKEEQKGKIDISFKEKENKLFVEITDDGVGRESAENKKNNKHTSFATSITNERIKSMKKSYKKNISFDIIDLKNNENSPTGTKVIFELPLLSA